MYILEITINGTRINDKQYHKEKAAIRAKEALQRDFSKRPITYTIKLVKA